MTRSRSAQRSVPLRAHGQLTQVDGDQTLVTVSAGPHNEAIAMWPATSGRLPFFDLHADSEWSPTRHYWHVALVQRVADHRWVHASIALVDDTADQLASLYAWLQRDDELRGRVRSVAAEFKPGDMGGVTETLTVALGSGGAVAVLAGTLSAWLSARRTRISVEITDGDSSRRVEIDSANASAAARLLREAYETTGGLS